jgi:hypothetical protein
MFDVRHSFSFNGIYELPFGSGRKFGSNLSGVANQILGGWEINAITILSGGNPVTITSSFNRADNADRRAPDRPDLKSGFSNNPTQGTSAGCLNPDGSVAVAPGTPLGTPTQWYDPCAFELPLWGTFGDLGRSSARSQGVIQVDFGLSKRFALTEEVGMQFRAEIFNVPNRANFSFPSARVFTSSGAIKGPAGNISRTVTTSRQIQFALKITF